ncbi:secretory lipase [Apiospora arundinis]|uniref:Secretory lipase n=1 Tax=Apiospora arundinis TaxID=335852 RepID=A0ABR2I0K2_9PEZI
MHARAAADRPPAPPAPTSPFCEGECRKNFTAGWEYDSSRWVISDLSQDSYWDLPSNLSSAVPGDILRWQDLDSAAVGLNWTIPGGNSLLRFQYATEDVDGATVAASAFLLMPYAAPRRSGGSGQLRTLAWAHGTAGPSKLCAPSNHKNLYYDCTTPRGLQWCAGWTHVADVAFGIAAARQRLGGLLTDEWAAIGQSEGGMTAWRVNQRLAIDNTTSFAAAGRFLGSVAIAPASSVIDILDDLKGQPPTQDGGVLEIAGYILHSLAALYPGQFRLEDYLTDWVPEGAFYKNDSWTSDPAVADWRKTYNREGLTDLVAPLLIVQGTSDGIVPPHLTYKEYEKTCAARPESRLTLLTYEGLNHDTVTNSAQADYMAWLDDLFNGKEVEQGCSRVNIKPLTNHFKNTTTSYQATM